MRILHLRFANLNSLVGEWQIDLTDSAYMADGIFSITGPTGAGKSTILDAICLALYGRTPRLGRITRSANEIMSRHTGQCFAEVLIDTVSGQYRCHWGQRRARKRPDGALQAPEHEMTQPDSGKVLAAGLQDTGKLVEQVTGLNFDRFTRSMLLAQGGFAAFLQAAPDERAPILEQMTGTDIYSQISITVHDRRRLEQQRLEALQAEVAGIEVLDAEAENALKAQRVELEKQEKQQERQVTQLTAQHDWLMTLAGLHDELEALRGERQTLEQALQRFAPKRRGLERARRAASLDAESARLYSLREEQQADAEAKAQYMARLPDLQKSARADKQTYDAASSRVVSSKQARDQAIPLIREIQALDHEITAAHTQWRELQQTADNRQHDFQTLEKECLRQISARNKIQSDRDDVLMAMEQHAPDAWLVSGLAGIVQQLDGLRRMEQEAAALRETVKQNSQALARAKQTLDNRVEQRERGKQVTKQAAQQIYARKRALDEALQGRTLTEYRQQKEALHREQVLLAKIVELEAERRRLQTGTPCPLCGATEHPFAIDVPGTPDHLDTAISQLDVLIQDIESRQAAIQELETSWQNARHQDAELTHAVLQARDHADWIEAQIVSANQQLERQDQERQRLRLDVAEALAPLGMQQDHDSDAQALLHELTQRRQRWLNLQERKAQLESQLSESQAAVARFDARADELKRAVHEAQENEKARRTALDSLRSTRERRYGNRDTVTEERRLEDAMTAAQQAEKKAHQQLVNTEQHLAKMEHEVAAASQRLEKRQPVLEQTEQHFLVLVTEAGFANEEDYRAARLTREALLELDQEARNLDTRLAQLDARQQDRQSRLKAVQSRNLTDHTLTQIAEQLAHHRDLLKTQQRDGLALAGQLQENNRRRQQIQDRLGAIEQQHRECRRWDDLHQLIGSSDGKKYRNFAQGLTFELMVSLANRQLQKMTDRYLLVRDQAQPLELNVVDNYQAGEVRSTRNLSGGESFLVSLALALGLSQMASKEVRLDSLFLDEGFGTLDEEALDTALETLSSLQHDGKMIGVISHVQALKERIGTQIVVVPMTGGRSRIQGPGCTQRAGP